MEKKVKKIPMRRCVGCNEHKPKAELLRVVRDPEGGIPVETAGVVRVFPKAAVSKVRTVFDF